MSAETVRQLVPKGSDLEREIVNRYVWGATIDEVVAAVGQSLHVVRTVLRRCRVTMRGRGARPGVSWQEEALAAYADGARPIDLATRFGVTRQAVSQMLLKRGVRREHSSTRRSSAEREGRA